MTCYRVGLRLNEPRLPALLVAHRRPGFYLRVLREGIVQAGDAIRQVGAADVRLSIVDVDGLLYLPGHDRREGVARAATIAASTRGGGNRSRRSPGTPDGARGNAGLTAVELATGVGGIPPDGGTAEDRETDTVTSVDLATQAGPPCRPPDPGSS